MIKEEDYDLSKFYFETSDSVTFNVKTIPGIVIYGDDLNSILKSMRYSLALKNEFMDKFGLYFAVAETKAANSKVTDYTSFLNKMKEIVDVSSSGTYLPLIKNSSGHWFRDVYFYLEKNQKYIEEDKDYFLITNEHWSKYDITEEDGKKILTPKTLADSEPWTAYEVNLSENPQALGSPINEDISEEDDDDKPKVPEYAGFSKYLYYHEGLTSTATQKEEGRRGMTNPRTKKLFTDYKWYKYDGSIEKADINNADREKAKNDKDPNLKSYIESDEDLLAAFEILEGSKSLDAQYILRDLKEFYVELGYFDKEDLRDPIRRILRWPLVEYRTPRMWPAAEINQDQEGYGVYIPSKTTLETVYDEDTLENNKDVVGEGFEPNIDVVSPVTGRIEEIGTKTVERIVTKKDGKTERIAYKDVGYITISAIDKTAPEETKPYEDFYKTEYEKVISGKVKYGKQSEDSRYLEGNKITIEGIKVEIPENVNDKGNSHYIRQLKSSNIKKVQDEKTREEAEAIEQRKIDAPNYISIAGSVGHVGDYIKEGTIIGKTTDSDIRISMRDCDKAFVENVDHYMVLDLGFYIEIMDDYYTKVEEGEANFVTDVEMFKYMFEGYPLLQEHAQDFLNMQEKYGVNAVFAAAVAIQECGAGNSTSGVNKGIRDQYGEPHNNIFSIKGSSTSKTYTNKNSKGETVYWNVYPDVASACNAFAGLISNHSGNYYWRADRYYVNEIAPTYCNPEWGVAVNSHITRALKKAQERQTGVYNIPEPLSGNNASRLIQIARSYVGKSVYGHNYGAKINGRPVFNCASFVCHVCRKAGLTKFQHNFAERVFRAIKTQPIYNLKEARPGDIIFTYGKKTPAPGKLPGHLGVYVGNGRYIHSNSSCSGGVSEGRITKFHSFKRLPGVNY